ncbi:hypothetical protein C6P46_005595 [Rhodotorula mucilaginosa]|uniref:Transcription factor domain-containing protein n=1 Tax=Rhodotorula mucilaginosa TaxID=5537 RepID=A0A9P6W0I3_RHOMI|nr:hypothetical protein C6P46_005595 [Rhodotorula mucilaginosa]
MQQQPSHPLASLSSAARYAANSSPVRTSELAQQHQQQGGSNSAGAVQSPEEYHPSSMRPSSPPRNAAAEDGGSIMTTQSTTKRRRTTLQDGNRTSEEPHLVKKTKLLSCTECKRGEPEACKWPDEFDKPQVDVQPFALTGDLVVLAQRIQSLEEWAQTLPAELREAAPVPTRFEPSLYGTTSKQKAHELGTSVRAKPRSRSGVTSKAEADEDHMYDAPSRDLSETEDAAIQLESMAFATRLPDSKYRPHDSLPLLDSAASPSTAGLAKSKGTNNADPQPVARELTAWGTSVVGHPLVYDGPWSGPALGLEMCFSLEELQMHYRRALDSIWPHMPDRALSQKLVAKYFDEIAWLHAVFHRETFEAEHDRAWEMIDSGRREEIDPLWLSCYFLVLALSLDGLRSTEMNAQLTPEELSRCDTMIWYGIAILIGQWLQTSSASGRVTAFLTILAGALRTAQIMGLHQLTSDPAHMPPPDPAWPPAACSMRRETALRLFHTLLFYDCLSASTRFRSYLLDPRQCTTPEPSNIDWSQMSITDWRIQPKPRSEYTDMSFEYAKHRSSEAYRLAFDKLLSGNTELSYTTILELDRMYRLILDECIQSLQTPANDTNTSEVTNRQRKRWMCEDGLHSRLVRLHRPFMTQYETSRKACVESATLLLQIHRRIAIVSRNVWFIYVHCLSAAICLFVDFFRAIDHDRPTEEIEEKRANLAISLDVFGHTDQVRSPSLRVVVQTGYAILRGLFEASDLRRTTRAAQALMGRKGGKEQPPVESFAAVLQRLTRQLSIDAQTTKQIEPIRVATGVTASAAALSSSSQFGATGASDQQPAASAAAPFISNGFGGSGRAPVYEPSPYNFNVPVDLSYVNGGEAYMPNEFFRDVGLTPGTIGFNLDYLSSGGGGGDANMQPVDAAMGATAPSGTGPAAYDPLQGTNGMYDWPAFAAGEATSEQGKLAASALMDQLATGMW